MFHMFKKYILSALLVTVFAATSPALAQLPAGNPITIDDVGGIVNIIARFLIIMSMVVAVIFIVLSGIMTMAAQADPTRYKNGLARLRHAIIGSAVVLGTGVILNTVAAIVDRSFFCQVQVLFICLY